MNKTIYIRNETTYVDAQKKAERENRSISDVIESLLNEWTYGNTELNSREKLNTIRKLLGVN